MAFASGSSSSFSAEINVTPLIDVLLVLLIIFMVIVPVAPRGLDSVIPQPSMSASPQTSPAVLSITSGPTGLAYAINTQPVVPLALRNSLASIFSARQNRTLFLQADRSLTYGQVAFAISEGKAAGAQTVAFMPAPFH